MQGQNRFNRGVAVSSFDGSRNYVWAPRNKVSGQEMPFMGVVHDVTLAAGELNLGQGSALYVHPAKFEPDPLARKIGDHHLKIRVQELALTGAARWVNPTLFPAWRGGDNQQPTVFIHQFGFMDGSTWVPMSGLYPVYASRREAYRMPDLSKALKVRDKPADPLAEPFVQRGMIGSKKIQKVAVISSGGASYALLFPEVDPKKGQIAHGGAVRIDEIAAGCNGFFFGPKNNIAVKCIERVEGEYAVFELTCDDAGFVGDDGKLHLHDGKHCRYLRMQIVDGKLDGKSASPIGNWKSFSKAAERAAKGGAPSGEGKGPSSNADTPPTSEVPPTGQPAGDKPSGEQPADGALPEGSSSGTPPAAGTKKATKPRGSRKAAAPASTDANATPSDELNNGPGAVLHFGGTAAPTAVPVSSDDESQTQS
ncbi:MAG: hypothetical protein U0136_12060 [Bdellovibrionota bacterium]